MQKELQQYELTFILDEKAAAEQGTAKAAQVKALIEKHGGNVTKEEHWGRRELAYVIKRNRSGFYVTMWFDLPAAELKEMNQDLIFDESLIRFLITKAYTSAQPGSLYPVVEEEKEKTGRKDKEETATAEEMLRRSATAKPSKKAAAEDASDEDLPEEERLKKLDDTLEELLKDEE